MSGSVGGGTVDLREAGATLGVSEIVLRRMAWDSEVGLEPKWGFRERLPRDGVDSWAVKAKALDCLGGSACEVNHREWLDDHVKGSP